MENNTIQKLVDISSLSRYHEKLKVVLETKQDVISDLEDIRSKANAAAGAADSAAAQALTDAKSYVDSKVDGKFDAAGAAAQALADAKSYVDGKVDGKFDAAGSAAQALADAKADAASLYQVKGDYEAAGTAAGFNAAMDERVKALEEIDHEQLAADASAAAVAAIVAGAESDFDTLKDVADWIDSHKEGAAELQITVSGHTESIDALEKNKQDAIEDLATIREGAAAGATALQSIPAEYITETELAGMGYLTNDDFGFATDADIDGLFA